MRGEVLSIDRVSGEALISGEGGGRYSASPSSARQALRIGDRIDFVASDGRATDIFVLASSPARLSPAPLNEAPARQEPGVWRYFVQCVTRKYATAHGRATVKEYWSFTLFFVIIVFVPMLLAMAVDTPGGYGFASEESGPLTAIVSIAVGFVWIGLFIPSVCVLIRRFHDVGLTGWLILIGGIPYIGWLFSFIVSVLPSQWRSNKHGPIPGRDASAAAEAFS